MSDIRARIVGVRITVRSKRRVQSWWHYYLSVTKGGLVINTDDCRDFHSLLASAEKRVIKYRGMVNRGVKLRSWDEIVAAVHS